MTSFVFEGYQIGFTFWRNRPFVKDIRGQKTFYAPLNVHRCYQDFIKEVQRRNLSQHDAKFALEYTTARYIATVTMPDTLPASMFTATAPGRFVDNILMSLGPKNAHQVADLAELQELAVAIVRASEPFRLLYEDDQIELALNAGIEKLRATHRDTGKVVYASKSEQQRLTDLIAIARSTSPDAALAITIQMIQRTFTRALLSGETSNLYQVIFGLDPQTSYLAITLALNFN